MDIIEYLFPGKFYRRYDNSSFTFSYNDNLMAPVNRMVTISQEDVENKWKGQMLWRQFLKFQEDNGMKTEEMKQSEAHLRRLTYMTYLAFPFGVFIGAAVINPVYIGRSSKILRRIIALFSGYYCLVVSYSYLNKWRYIYHAKFFNNYPPQVREFLKSKDHRYLLLFDFKNSPYRLWDEKTKLSLY